MFFIVFDNMLSLFFIMAMGFIAAKLKIIDDTISSALSTVLINITLPATIISAMQRPFSIGALKEIILVLVVTCLIYAFSIFIGMIALKCMKADQSEKNIYLFACTFSNMVYMGFPVISAIFGHEALFYGSIANIVFNLVAFSIGILMIKKDTTNTTDIKKYLIDALKSIPIIAVFIGLIIFFAGIKLPQPLFSAFSMTGAVTVPLSMLIVGALLSKSNFLEMFNSIHTYFITFLRLIVIPLLVLLVLKHFITNKTLLGVLVIITAMPPASLTVIFAEKYGGNAPLASKVVFISTLFSVFTIPFMTIFLN